MEKIQIKFDYQNPKHLCKLALIYIKYTKKQNSIFIKDNSDYRNINIATTNFILERTKPSIFQNYIEAYWFLNKALKLKPKSKTIKKIIIKLAKKINLIYVDFKEGKILNNKNKIEISKIEKNYLNFITDYEKFIYEFIKKIQKRNKKNLIKSKKEEHKKFMEFLTKKNSVVFAKVKELAPSKNGIYPSNSKISFKELKKLKFEAKALNI